MFSLSLLFMTGCSEGQRIIIADGSVDHAVLNLTDINVSLNPNNISFGNCSVIINGTTPDSCFHVVGEIQADIRYKIEKYNAIEVVLE